MRIAILGSSGGSAFRATLRILADRGTPRHELIVATDRACGFDDVCRDYGLTVHRIAGHDNAARSAAALDVFRGADAALLYYTRLVTADLYEAIPTYNIHPSLLPAFPGMSAVRDALAHGARFLGATLHRVDATVDGGPIIGQVVMPMTREMTEAQLQKYSYVQKVYLSLLFLELLEHGESWPAYTDRCNPALRDPAFLAGMEALEREERVRVTRP